MHNQPLIVQTLPPPHLVNQNDNILKLVSLGLSHTGLETGKWSPDNLYFRGKHC